MSSMSSPPNTPSTSSPSSTPTTPTRILFSGFNVKSLRHPNAETRATAATGDKPCFLCGKDTDGRRLIHLATWGEIVPVSVDLHRSKDQGWFPIGPECAKKLPAGYVALETDI